MSNIPGYRDPIITTKPDTRKPREDGYWSKPPSESMKSHRQDDVVFPEVPTMEVEGVTPGTPEARLLESHFGHVYEAYHNYLKSWQTYLRAERKFLRYTNRKSVWDVPANSAKNINGFKNGMAAVFFEKTLGNTPHGGRLPKRAMKFY